MATPTPLHPDPPTLVRVRGSHRAIGRQLCEALKSQIAHSRETTCALIEHPASGLNLTWDGAVIQAQKYIPFAQERYPQYVDEIMGIAEGSGIPFDDLCVLTTFEAVTSDALHLGKCTSMAVNGDLTTDGHMLIAHNEDWTPEDEQDVALVHASPDDEPPFLAMMYGGYLPNIEIWHLREKTVCALIIDLTAHAMHIAWGNPCQNPTHTFFLETGKKS
jgi:isopenicillin-N N-acyltransferase-like protein